MKSLCVCLCVYLTQMSSLHGWCTRTRAAPRAQPGVHLTRQPSSQQQPGQVGFLKVHLEQKGRRRVRMCCECVGILNFQSINFSFLGVLEELLRTYITEINISFVSNCIGL